MMLATAIGVAAGAGGLTLVARQDRIDDRIHDYILENPEIIPEAMKRLQSRDTAQLLSKHRAAIETPFAGAWAGSSHPAVTVTMFTDYSCGYCRASVADVDRLLGEEKAIRVVWREIPILGPGSEAAAHAALAAAEQGHYLDFHRRMFAAGPPDGPRIIEAMKQSNVRLAETPAIVRELDGNLVLARALGVTGTPTFVIGDQILQGAVGYDKLKQAIADARKG